MASPFKNFCAPKNPVKISFNGVKMAGYDCTDERADWHHAIGCSYASVWRWRREAAGGR